MEIIDDPNFSIVAPGGCNAKCSFCFWKEETGYKGWHYDVYVRNAIRGLPYMFQSCSITGGEPTLSPVFRGILLAIKGHFERVVLTTNGAKILDFIQDLKGIVNHVNLSRHAVSDIDNFEKFGTINMIPTTSDVRVICAKLNRIGIDVTLNCVVDGDEDLGFVNKFTSYAKYVGASAVCFRMNHKHGLKATKLLAGLDHNYARIGESECPVCESATFLIDGVRVRHLMSTEEPSNDWGVVYEAILHANTKLTYDWAGKNILMFKPNYNKREVKTQPARQVSCADKHLHYLRQATSEWKPVHIDTSLASCDVRGCEPLSIKRTGCGAGGC